jgi:hypothetical protein
LKQARPRLSRSRFHRAASRSAIWGLRRQTGSWRSAPCSPPRLRLAASAERRSGGPHPGASRLEASPRSGSCTPGFHSQAGSFGAPPPTSGIGSSAPRSSSSIQATRPPRAHSMPSARAIHHHHPRRRSRDSRRRPRTRRPPPRRGTRVVAGGPCAAPPRSAHRARREYLVCGAGLLPARLKLVLLAPC